MPVPPTPVAAAPEVPDRAQRATFSARATAFFDWIKNTFVAGVNDLASNVYANAQDAASSAANAVAQSASATAQAGIATAQAAAATSAAATATTQAGVATTQAASIATAAATATAKADVATAKAAEATAAAATATAVTLGVATGYPIIRPSLTLDFANSQIFDPRITFTRANTATRVNGKGQIETVAANVPRIDFDPVSGECRGPLIEEQRTNLLAYSEQLDNSAKWLMTRSSVTPNVIVAPDGTLTADKLVESTDTSSSHYLYCGANVTAGTAYTLSFYIKAAERTNVALQFHNNNAAFAYSSAYFNIGTGVITNSAQVDSATITPMGNGWYRISATKTATSTALATVSIILVSTGTTIAYTGNGTSGLNIWGAQLEAGTFPTSYIPSTETFTGRASTATYYNSLGQIALAASGVARYSYNPADLTVAPKLLLEAAGTNLLTYSEQFDDASWSKIRSSVVANATTAPDGTLTADKFVEDTTASASHYLYHLTTKIASAIKYTYSVYVKAAERSQVCLLLDTSIAGNTASCIFDVSSGSTSNLATSGGFSETSASIIPAGNGWYRCSITSTSDSDTIIYTESIISVAGSTAYTGNGTSGIYIWGAQLEAAPLSSYIPTTTAAVTRAADTSTSAATTRAADVPVMTGSNFSSWYRQDEGTFVCTFDSTGSTGTVAPFGVATTGVFDESMYVSRQADGGVFWNVIDDGISQFSAISLGTAASGVAFNVAVAYKLNDSAAAGNGSALVTDNSCTLPTVDRLAIGASPWTNSGGFINGHIRRLAYYPKRLTNAELQTLSAQ